MLSVTRLTSNLKEPVCLCCLDSHLELTQHGRNCQQSHPPPPVSLIRSWRYTRKIILKIYLYFKIINCFPVDFWLFANSGCPPAKQDQHVTFICIVNQSVRSDLFRKIKGEFSLVDTNLKKSCSEFFYLSFDQVPHFIVDATLLLVQCIHCVHHLLHLHSENT